MPSPKESSQKRFADCLLIDFAITGVYVAFQKPRAWACLLL